MRVRKGGKLDYGSASALTQWPYLLNALQKKKNIPALACTRGTVWCWSWWVYVFSRVCMWVELIPCQPHRPEKWESLLSREARPASPSAGSRVENRRAHSFPGDPVSISPSLIGTVTSLLLGILFLHCQAQMSNLSLCLRISKLCAFDVIFPVEAARNYGLHCYCGKIANCQLLRMKLSHMLSRAPVWSPNYPAAQEHTHPLQS